MEVCYTDESGNSSTDPCLVMVGIVVDAARLNRTRTEFAGIFDEIQSIFEENLRELKGSKMIFGRDRWRKVDPELRKSIAGYLCDWVSKRKHTLALAAIDRARHAKEQTAGLPEPCKNVWLACGLHVALQIQKFHQSKEKNKGNTFLIFDDNKREADTLSDLIFGPPEWTDQYYDRGKKQDRLDQIIDTTFAIRSHQAGLVQVADLFAFILRRHAELSDYGSAEEWPGERMLIEDYTSRLVPRLLPIATRWPRRPGDNACPAWFNSIAPRSLKELGQ